MLKVSRLFSRQSSSILSRRFERLESSNVVHKPIENNLGRHSLVPDVYDFPSLSKSPSWLPTVKYASPTSNRYDTNVTTLDNGLKVASEKLFGDFCTVGVVISSGPRFEGNYLNGVSHFLEKLAFMSTEKYQSRDDVIDSLHQVNAICDCQSARDIIIYASSCRTTGVERVIELLSQTILKPKLLPEEIDIARRAILNEIDDLHNRRYDPTPIIADMVHTAGFGKKTLGQSKYTPLENVDRIDANLLRNYTEQFYRPERMVLAGVGIDHEQLVDLGKKYFSIPKSTDGRADENEKAVWTGGVLMEERDLSHLSFGTDPLPEIVHLGLGFEAPSHREEHDFVTACVLSQMMGGGGSFSAGGPGKGLYSRFYMNVLNRHEEIKTAISYNQAYNDTGCLYFHIGGDPSYLRSMVDVAIREIGFLVSYPPKLVELERAKAQLQSMLFMNLEQRPVVFEDVARQVLAVGKRQSADYYFNRIKRVQAEDIQAVSKRIFSSPVALVGLGKGLEKMPSYVDISDTIQRQLKPNTRWRILG